MGAITIHEDNTDIAYPWSETWHLHWIKAHALVLMFAFLSDHRVRFLHLAMHSVL